MTMDGYGRRFRSLRWLALATLAALLATGVLLYRGATRPTLRLRISGGDAVSHRHELALRLQRVAAARKLILDVKATGGSEEALQQVNAATLDIAMIQGGLTPLPNVRQIATLVDEPVHLLVRPELVDGGLDGLRGLRINLGPMARGTRVMAIKVLSAAGLQPGDYRDEALTYRELLDQSAEAMPDAVFIVSALPSPAVERLVKDRGYRLMPLPLGDALEVRDRAVHGGTIPRFTYSYSPPVPDGPLPTPATRMLIVARTGVTNQAITRLLETVFETDFALAAELPTLQADSVLSRHEFPLHDGALQYLNRNQPVIDGQFIEGLENLRSFIVSGLLALFLVWQWWTRRQAVGFERYLDDVSRLEKTVLTIPVESLTLTRLRAAHDELTRIKTEALEQFCAGKLPRDDHLQSFLLHVADVRRCLVELADRVDT